MPAPQALDVSALYRRCAPEQFDFKTTAELSATTEIVGQRRTVDAVRLGIEMRRPGYNLFVLGEPGSGRHCAVRRRLEGTACGEAVPRDWCYVYNFAEANKPRLLRLPAGRGGQLREDMRAFVAELGKAIAAAFESDEYRARVEAIQEAAKAREEQALLELGQASSEQGIALLRTPHGFAFAPMNTLKGMNTLSYKYRADKSATAQEQHK